nr:MAG TPA: excisionase [Caudoviricetes sp.]
MYNLVHCTDFPKKVVGGRILIPAKALERWLENGEAVEPA